MTHDAIRLLGAGDEAKYGQYRDKVRGLVHASLYTAFVLRSSLLHGPYAGLARATLGREQDRAILRS